MFGGSSFSSSLPLTPQQRTVDGLINELTILSAEATKRRQLVVKQRADQSIAALRAIIAAHKGDGVYSEIRRAAPVLTAPLLLAAGGGGSSGNALVTAPSVKLVQSSLKCLERLLICRLDWAGICTVVHIIGKVSLNCIFADNHIHMQQAPALIYVCLTLMLRIVNTNLFIYFYKLSQINK